MLTCFVNRLCVSLYAAFSWQQCHWYYIAHYDASVVVLRAIFLGHVEDIFILSIILLQVGSKWLLLSVAIYAVVFFSCKNIRYYLLMKCVVFVLCNVVFLIQNVLFLSM